MNCPVCGGPYIIGGQRHTNCEKVQRTRARVDEAVEWLLSDDPDRGPMPDLVRRLREEVLSNHTATTDEEEG